MKILVIGATGKTGQKLLAQRSSPSYHVTGLIRDPHQAHLVEQFNAQPILGDLENDTAITQFYDAVFFVAGSRGKNIEGVDYEGLAKAVKAAENYGIHRFIYLSSINVGKSPEQYIQEMIAFYQDQNETIPDKLLSAAKNPNYYRYVKMKALAENAITASSLNYTILRAGLLTQDEGSAKIEVATGTLNRFGKISRENIALCYLRILEEIKTYRKIYTVLDGNIPVNEAFTTQAEQQS